MKLVVKIIICRSSSAVNDVRGGTGGAGRQWGKQGPLEIFSVQKYNPFFVNFNPEQVWMVELDICNNVISLNFIHLQSTMSPL